MKNDDKPVDLDKWIDEALMEVPDVDIPDSFCDKVVSMVEKRIAWQRLLSDFWMKVLLVGFALAILGLTFFFSLQSKAGSNKDIIYFFSHHSIQICEILFCLAFTFFMDQVVMKYFNGRVKGE